MDLDKAAPTISILSPTPRTVPVSGGVINVFATAHDGSGGVRVTFMVDGQKATDLTPPLHLRVTRPR
jgi:hypothetical protein